MSVLCLDNGLHAYVKSHGSRIESAKEIKPRYTGTKFAIEYTTLDCGQFAPIEFHGFKHIITHSRRRLINCGTIAEPWLRRPSEEVWITVEYMQIVDPIDSIDWKHEGF